MDIRIKESRKNIPIGWVLCESSMEEDALTKPKLLNTDDRRVIGEARFQRGNKKNRNGRWYDTKDLIRQQTIDPNNVVAFILKLWMDGDFVMGNFKGSNLPIGEAFDQDLRDGMLPAWSLRALGTVENTNRGAEVKGVKIITYDRVYYPSHPEAYTTKVLSESAIIDSNGNPFKTPVPESSKDKKICEEGLVVPVVNQQVIDYIQQESCNFKQICNEFEVFYDDISLIENGTKVQLSNSKTGNVFIVSLESYIHNEIMDYCSSHR